jgi:menaquinone-9 beta-reductase
LKTVIIIGGGVSGLIASILLARNGIDCTVIEKKNYPLHRVCGEYISNEAVPFLKAAGLFPDEFAPPELSKFQLSSVSGKSSVLPLGMGGFGVSRFAFDNFLFSKAKESGVQFQLDTSVENVEFLGQSFKVLTNRSEIEAKIVIGSFGKRSNLDLRLDRKFIKHRSPYVGVKYHVHFDHPVDVVALHNFPGGYCGISAVENNIINVCYLVHRDNLKKHKSIREMEQHVLTINPFLNDVFKNAHFLFEKPEVINEISFDRKNPVEEHILMCGDAAGLITPLCGNGIAMAIHSAKICAEHVTRHWQSKTSSNNKLEQGYASEWTLTFSRRLYKGRQIQKLFGSDFTSSLAVNLALYVKPVAIEIIRNTHGKTF